MLTASLEKVFAEASKLSEDEQSALAAWILREIDSQQYWDRALSNSPDELAWLAEEALTEHRRGQTRVIKCS
ncbi:hypothetical protein ACFL6S_08190 [Candidatus Poribacteria bacterium]